MDLRSLFRGGGILGIFLILVIPLRAQSYLEQRKAEAYDATLSEETRLEALNWLIKFYGDPYVSWQNPDSALAYSILYENTASSGNTLFHQINSLVQRGNSVRIKRQFDEAGRLYDEAEALNPPLQFPDLTVDLLMGQARILSSGKRQSIDSAKYLLQKALELSLKQGDQVRASKANVLLAEQIFSSSRENDLIRFEEALRNAMNLSHSRGEESRIWKSRAANLLASHYFSLYEDSLAFVYQEKALELISEVNDDMYRAQALPVYRAIENLAYSTGQIEVEISCLEAALDIAPDYELFTLKARALLDLGLSYESENATALRYNEWCRAYADSIGDHEHQALARNNLGNLYKRNGDYEKALELYEEAIPFVRESLEGGFQNTSGRGIGALCFPLLNVGDIYLDRGEYEKAKENYLQALELNRTWGGGYDKALVLSCLAVFYQESGKLDSAIMYQNLQEATMDSIPVDQVDPAREFYNRHNIAGFRIEMGEYQPVIENYYPLFQKYSSGDNKYTAVILAGTRYLTEAFKATGRFEEALDMMELQQEISDSLNSAANQQATLRFDFQQKTIRDSLTNVQAQAAIKAEYDDQVEFRNYILLALAGLILGGLLWFRYRRQRQLAETQQAKLQASEELNQRLQQVDKLKDQFLANTSHELRTPLHGIIGIAEGMVDEDTTPEARENLGMVIASGKRLASLVNDLLDFSRIQNADLELRQQPVDLRAVVNIVLQVSFPLAQGKPIELRNNISEDLPAVHADEDRLSQVLYNLIGNAIKFTEKGEVTITAEEKNERIEVSVKDTGIGIPSEQQEAIFEVFTQADGSIQRSYGGTGLGLSISRQLIQAHGGNLWVESAKGKGSTFSFTLPITDQSPQTVPETGGLALSSLVSHGEAETPTGLSVTTMDSKGHLRILIVDDEPINHQVLKNHLKGENFELHSAMNGPEALSLLEDHENSFDMVLLDVMMPRMSGYEVAQKIRERFLPSELPIILVTAKNQVADLVRGLETGANDYLAKPFTKDEFLARLKTHLNLQQINRATGRFVPTEFIRTLGKTDITEVQLGDHTATQVTVFFSDIRDYTGLSESMTLEENFHFVQAYARRMGPHISGHQGFVNQYLGDGIMAIFQQSPEDAVKAAIGMQQSITAYNQERKQKGRPSLSVGMGLHTGPLIMGVIGDVKRTDPAVIADTVNIAARLEGLTKYYGAQIILSEDSFQSLDQETRQYTRYLGLVQVKGRSQPMGIYECFAAEQQAVISLKQTHLQTFQSGLEEFIKGNMDMANRAFTPLAAQGDQVAAYFQSKATEYLDLGIPEDWKGVDVMEGK